MLPYTREPQGEAISWSIDPSGYYTVSEEVLNIPAHLYFYPRLDPVDVETKKNKDEGFNFYLEQNYPNPFNPETNIGYYISEYSSVSLKIYNILGEEVADLLHEKRPPGKYQIVFNAANLSNGTYFYKLRTDELTEVKAMTLLK